jgi:hypothetical protein
MISCPLDEVNPSGLSSEAWLTRPCEAICSLLRLREGAAITTGAPPQSSTLGAIARDLCEVVAARLKQRELSTTTRAGAHGHVRRQPRLAPLTFQRGKAQVGPRESPRRRCQGASNAQYYLLYNGRLAGDGIVRAGQ